MPETKIEIILNYTPEDYFEESVFREFQNCSIEIGRGHAIARMTADFFDSHPDFRDSLQKELALFFLGAQPYRREPFEFTGGGINRVLPDGRRSISRWVPVILEVLPRDDDRVYTDDEGVVHDPRQERIESMKELGELSILHAPANPIIRRMLDSFDASIRYPGNELVYLYEVCDALQTNFRGEKKARKALGISKSDRSALTELANSKPLNQGRHRGQHAGRLRNATTEELAEARKIAREMIAKYMAFLDRQLRPRS